MRSSEDVTLPNALPLCLIVIDIKQSIDYQSPEFRNFALDPNYF